MRNRVLLAVCCLGIFGFSSVAQAFRPEVTDSIPRGMQRGTTQKVVFSGNRLNDSRQLLFERDGINVKSLKPLDNRKVEVELEVPADTEPGLYPLRVVSETGISNMLMFGVGAMPSVDEKEPNSDFEAPQAIENNVTVEGVVAREDEDYYVVELKKGERLTAELEGVRIQKGRSNPFFDPYVAILNSERFELATSDDAPLLQQDCVCSIEAPEDGKYIVLVRDSSFGGRNDRYRLHIGSYPRAIAVVPAGGPPGEIVDMTFISISGDAWIEKVQMPSEVSDRFPLTVSNEQGVSPSPNYVRVQPMPNVIEKEPNNNFKESTPGALPAAMCGVIGEPDDNDYFSFEAKKNQTVHVQLYAREVLRSELDGVVNLYNDKGGRVAGNDDSRSPDSFFEFRIPEDGRYHVRINDHLRGGGPGYAYRLEVTQSEPELTLTLPDRRRYEATHIEIPQGNRAAVMINASRRRVGGPVDISALNLPEGVEVTPLQMPESQNTVPLLMSAAADAPLDGRRVDLVGKIPESDVESEFTQQHQLMIGRNNNVVFDYYSDRAGVAVIKALPCTISIEAPQVPLVRNGAMELTVKIDRGGLDADVPVRLLYNPPGIGSSRSINISKGQTEAKIPLTANGSAAIGKWPIIVYASVQGNEIASEPVTLEVADRIFNYGFPKTSGELGATANVLVDLEINREFEGEAEIELVGLPAGVTCEKSPQSITQDTEQVVFPVTISKDARVGQHKTLVARGRITSDKGVITQTQGTGILQIDQPLEEPKKKDEGKPAEKKPANQPKPEAKKKPLSRLEQLRLMHEKKTGEASPTDDQ